MAKSQRETIAGLGLSEVGKTNVLVDERGRLMRFPSRWDYLDLFVRTGIIGAEGDLISNPKLNEAVYLDWLRRGQVGCVFAQLLARPAYRSRSRTVVLYESANSQPGGQLAEQIDAKVRNAVADPNAESLSILLPAVLSAEYLVHLVLCLSAVPRWTIERESRWRRRLIRVGLRVEIGDEVWAEVLGVGPFLFFPPTRQSPITTLEIRTKRTGAKKSKLSRKMLASHLADIETGDFLSPKQHRILFKTLTPGLRNRILGGEPDERAKAGVTFVLPAAIWSALKSDRS